MRLLFHIIIMSKKIRGRKFANVWNLVERWTVQVVRLEEIEPDLGPWELNQQV